MVVSLANVSMAFVSADLAGGSCTMLTVLSLKTAIL